MITQPTLESQKVVTFLSDSILDKHLADVNSHFGSTFRFDS